MLISQLGKLIDNPLRVPTKSKVVTKSDTVPIFSDEECARRLFVMDDGDLVYKDVTGATTSITFTSSMSYPQTVEIACTHVMNATTVTTVIAFD